MSIRLQPIQPPGQEAVFWETKAGYIPIRLRTAYASASQGAIVASTGTKVPRPTHRKNNHIHQPEIVLGIVMFILHSPYRMILGCPHRTTLPYTTLFGFRGCAAHGRIWLNHCSQQSEVSYLTIGKTIKFESPINIESYIATKTIRVLDSMFTHDNNHNSC
jgi:hypothetical protein